jgi:DNA-binding FrmR family transcriptional regulator
LADNDASYPSHDSELDSLARIEGQVRGIRGMVVDRRYCVDILIQIRAVHAALRRVERNILQSYLQNCVQQAFCDGTEADRERKVAEILALFDWESGKPAR